LKKPPNFLSAGLGLFAVALLPGCAKSDFASQAYEKTAVFGQTRALTRRGNELAYQFAFRDGIVTYLPSRGSYWEKSANFEAPPETSAGAGTLPALSDRLPHGCLVFACSRAETLRRDPASGAARPQAVSFQRTDGSGHAFVVYDLRGTTWAEDDRGYRVKVDHWTDRNPRQALALAREFSSQTHPANYPKPANAEFVGEY